MHAKPVFISGDKIIRYLDYVEIISYVFMDMENYQVVKLLLSRRQFFTPHCRERSFTGSILLQVVLNLTACIRVTTLEACMDDEEVGYSSLQLLEIPANH